MHYDFDLLKRWTLHLEMMCPRHVRPTILILIQRMGMKSNLPMSPRKQTIFAAMGPLTMQQRLVASLFVGQVRIPSLIFWSGMIHLLWPTFASRSQLSSAHASKGWGHLEGKDLWPKAPFVDHRHRKSLVTF
jgi:hypothetical protein